MENHVSPFASQQKIAPATPLHHPRLRAIEDRVATVFWVGLGFQFIDQIQATQIADCIKKHIQPSNANDAIDLALLVTDSNNHALFFDGTYIDGICFKFLQNFPVELTHFFSLNKSCFHPVLSVVGNGTPLPNAAAYARKYIRKIFPNAFLGEGVAS